MDRELNELRRRIATLERTIAAAGVAIVALLVVAASTSMRAAGPSTVTAPFTVVDASGRLLMKVEAQPGRGAMASFFNESGRSVLQAGGSPSGCCGWVGVFAGDGGRPKAQLAVQTDDSGVVRLAGEDDSFSQVSGKGFAIRRSSHNLATLSASPAGGVVRLNDVTGTPTVRIEGVGEAGKMTIFGKGADRTTLGVAADDAGLIRLDSTTRSFTMLHGNAVIRTVNADGQAVTELGSDQRGNGILDIRHKSGSGGVRLEVADDGTGTMKIHALPFEIKAQIGVKEGGKGDVCVEGSKGLICLSGIAIKNFIPW